MADLTTLFAGKIRCPNPFWLASRPARAIAATR